MSRQVLGFAIGPGGTSAKIELVPLTKLRLSEPLPYLGHLKKNRKDLVKGNKECICKYWTT